MKNTKLIGLRRYVQAVRVAAAVFCGLAVVWASSPVCQGLNHHDGGWIRVPDNTEPNSGIAHENGCLIEVHEHYESFLMTSISSYGTADTLHRWTRAAVDQPRPGFQERIERPPPDITTFESKLFYEFSSTI